MSIYEKLPSLADLKTYAKKYTLQPCKVNGHFHTPYSFSAFKELEQVFIMACDEQVDILGINDFYTMSGYEEFAELCVKYKKFPLFNIEFMGLLKKEQANGIRVNDPNNPGRTYFSGKGLDFPVSLSGISLEKLESVRQESDRQTREMVLKASAHLEEIDSDLRLSYDEILENYTRGMVRERHIAQVIRTRVFDKYGDLADRKEVFRKIFQGKESQADFSDTAALDNEIRSMLLKSGGVAFVKEDPKAFLEISEVIQIIRDAGGIPCYPVLLDDKSGNYTEYESDMNLLDEKLSELKVYSLELIPGRNKFSNLRRFVEFFDQRGYIITLGTEHNTPAMEDLSVRASDSELDEYLSSVSYQGACFIAAHQYLRSLREQGCLDENGMPVNRAANVLLGNAIIHNFINPAE